MRTKVIQLVLFVVVVTAGFFVIDSALNAAPRYCSCENFELAQSHCDSVCADHGGCNYFYSYPTGCTCYSTTCHCLTYFVCMDDTLSSWYVSSDYCEDCYY